MRDIKRTWLLMLGTSAMVIASSFAPAQADAQVQRTGSGIRVSKDAYLPTTGPVTETAEGTVVDADINAPGFNAVDAEVYRSMSDANIMSHMIVGDSLEIEIARLAAERAGDPEVREFARMLVDEHSRHLSVSLEMARDEDIGSTPADGDRHGVTMRRWLNHLRTLGSSPTFDRTFLRYQIRHHDFEAQALRAMRPAARDDDLEQHIDETLPTIERHLNRARELGARMNAGT
jgi:putative membrane protein